MTRPVPAAEINALRADLDAGKHASVLARAIELCEAADLPGRATLQLLISNAYGILGEPVKALAAARDAMGVAQSLADPALEGEALLMASASHQAVEEHGKALELLGAAENIAEQVGNTHLLHKILRRMGVSCSLLGRHDAAQEYLQRSVNIFPVDAPRPEWLTASMSMLNARARRTNAAVKIDAAAYVQFLPMIDDWRALSQEADRLNCTRIAALAECNRGIVLASAHRYEEAISVQHDAQARFHALGMRSHEGEAWNTLGSVYNKLQRFVDARDAYRHAITFLEGTSPRSLSDAWDGLAVAHEGLDQPREALAAIKKAREFDLRMMDSEAVANAERLERRSEMARITRELTRLAHEDALTGLTNRRGLEVVLTDDFARGFKEKPGALMMIDADHFKTVNDRFGHGVGDMVLRALAELIRKCSRGNDLAVRWGGEEFILWLPNTGPEQAAQIAERLRELIAMHAWNAIRSELNVTASIGVAYSHEATVDSAQTLIDAADRRLYAAKEQGRNRAVGEG